MKLCVALDHPSYEENLKLCKQIRDFDVWLKVGFRTFIKEGKRVIEDIKEINEEFKIFLDLKLYDIPNTMADAAQEIAELGVDMFNVHASSGKVAMREVMKRLEGADKRPLVLAVTALTSFDNHSFREIYNEDLSKKAISFAKDSFQSDLDGVVCSVFESLQIKEATDENFLTLTPGIRPFNEESKDQKRVADLKTAKEYKSDFIVVGRPIYQSKDPYEIVKRILGKI